MGTPVIPESPTPLATAETFLALGAGLALLTYGSTRRSVAGACVALASSPLIYRGVTGRWPGFVSDGACDDTRAALSGRNGVHVREAVRLEVPIERVYRFWRDLENLPAFMTHLYGVSESYDGLSHWIARGPADARVEWDAELISDEANQTIAWRSLPGSDVISAGSVRFDRVRGGRSTQVTVHLQYAPPAGTAGDWLAWFFGRAPSQTIREDLRHLKQILEAGELAKAGSDPGESAR
jgi:uncharacterized membrane protein